MRILCVLALCVSSPLAAEEQVAVEMTEQQIAALAVLTPLAQAQVPGENGVHLAECMLLSSKRRELCNFAKATPGDMDDKTVAMANKVIQRPAVASCLTERLSK